MLNPTVWKTLLHLEDPVVVTGAEVLGQGSAAVLIVDVRLRAGRALRCGICLSRAPRYDLGKQRTWRAPDVGVTPVRVRARVARVRCARHWVTVAAVPWARHGAGHTRAFDDQVAWSVVTPG